MVTAALSWRVAPATTVATLGVIRTVGAAMAAAGGATAMKAQTALNADRRHVNRRRTDSPQGRPAMRSLSLARRGVDCRRFVITSVCGG